MTDMYKGDTEVALVGHGAVHKMILQSESSYVRVYKLFMGDVLFYRLEGDTNTGTLYAVDLDGGPMIHIGDILESEDGKGRYELTLIAHNKNDFELTFKKHDIQ